MTSPNTLFILSKHGLKLIDKKGICESWMWLLTEDEESMKYLSLHKSKSDRAYKGGEILGIREATDDEVVQHHEEIDKENPEKAKNRKIVTFQIDRDWHALWPKDARKNPMAYKGVGHIEKEPASE